MCQYKEATDMSIRRNRLFLYTSRMWVIWSSAILILCVYLGWMCMPRSLPTEGTPTEDPDMTGLMMGPVFSTKNQPTGDTLTIKAHHAYHQEHRHYSLHQPQCCWQGDHGLITLVGGRGYWNHHIKQGSLWHNVVLRYDRKGHIQTQQVHWDAHQRIWSHHPTRGRYESWRFQSDGFLWLSDRLTLKGPARIQWSC